jgi:hypothetical protein
MTVDMNQISSQRVLLAMEIFQRRLLMKRFGYWGILILMGVGAWGMGPCLRVADAQEPSRQQLLKEFRELSAQSKAAYNKVGFRDVKSLGPVYAGKHVPLWSAVGPQRDKSLMIKVWAVPLDGEGNLAKNKVHLGKYRWEPKQQFAIFFESAVPVQVGLYEDFENKKSECRAPDPEFPSSYQTVKAGEPYRFPADIMLENTFDDELISIVVVAAGKHPELPELPPPPPVVVKKDDKYLALYSREFERVSDAVRKHKSLFKLKQPDFESSPNVDEAALIAYGSDRFGYLQIRIRKKKN